jgi:3-phosphoglycerate kinase
MFKSLRDFNFNGKRVLVRCDFNVPLSEQGDILDDFRIKAVIPTIEYLVKNKAKVILISHLGELITLKPIALRLEKLLDKKIKFLGDCVEENVKKEINEIKNTEIALLENLRLHKGEKNNDLEFAKQLAELGDIYINDAFAVCHREHASVVGIPKILPSAAGILLEREIRVLQKIMRNPEKPLIAIIGGKKVGTKCRLINKISESADFVLIGNLLRDQIKQKNLKLRFPKKIIFAIDGVLSDEKELDIGPKTIKIFKEKILTAKTIFWNGPLGKTEEKKFTKGSLAIAQAIIKSEAHSIAGGGETIAFLKQQDVIDEFDYISTGGGAMLKFLSNESLPGLEALNLTNYE